MEKDPIDLSCIEFDADGYLKNYKEWTPEIACFLAKKQGICLTESHWEIIYLTREFYQEFEMSPHQRIFSKYISKKLDPMKGTSAYLMQLFTGQSAKMASLIAGLPKSDRCF